MAMAAVQRTERCRSQEPKTAAVEWTMRVTRSAYLYAVGSPIGGLLVTWPVHSLILMSSQHAQRVMSLVDFWLDVVLAMAWAAAERVYASLPRTVKLCVDEFLWARAEFEKQFEKRLPRQKRQQQEHNQQRYQHRQETDAASGDDGSSSMGGGVVMDIDNVLRIISASREAFTAVVSSKDAYTTTAVANAPVVGFEPTTSMSISIHGIWRLDVERSQTWNALFDVLGIAKKSTVVRPAMQEFTQKDGTISHRILSASGKPRESTPKLFTIGARALAERQGNGEVIYTRYFFGDDGATLIQEACNPDKDVTVITSRTLEDNNTMIQTSEATKGNKHAAVTRVFVRVPQPELVV